MIAERNFSESVHNINTSDIKEIQLSKGFLKYIAGTISTFGLLENMLIILTVFVCPRVRRYPHVFFILCLSFSDALFSTTIIMLSVSSLFETATSTRLCKSEYILMHLSFLTSLGVTFLICLERYLATANNFSSLHIFNKRKTLYVILAWFIGVIYMCGVFLIVPSNIHIAHCEMKNLYVKGNHSTIYGALSLIYIPLLVTTVILYLMAAFKIRNRFRKMDIARPQQKTKNETVVIETCLSSVDHNNGITPIKSIQVTTIASNLHGTNHNPSQNVTLDRSHSYRSGIRSNFKVGVPSTSRVVRTNNALKTVSIIVTAYVICLAPALIEHFIKIFHTPNPSVSNVTNSLVLLNTVANPILYVWRFRDLRKELKRIKC